MGAFSLIVVINLLNRFEICLTIKMVSIVRQNFHEECETGINKQINMELSASHIHQSMAYYCDRDDVTHHKLHEMFKKSAIEEREHAVKLMGYQNRRGGTVALQDIMRPEVAEKHGDFQLADFIQGQFLMEQVEAIKQLADLLTRAKRCGDGLGEFLFKTEAL